MKTKMETQTEPHDIFVTDPVELLKYVGCYVNITVDSKEVLKGTVYTIDPVSQSIILIKKEDGGNLSLKIVMKHSVTSMEIISEVPALQQNILQKDVLKLENSTPKTDSKENVKLWLLKNLIPVLECDDKLVVDNLEIHPPYGVDQCYCNNSIVLSRIQNLLSQMPFKES